MEMLTPQLALVVLGVGLLVLLLAIAFFAGWALVLRANEFRRLNEMMLRGLHDARWIVAKFDEAGNPVSWTKYRDPGRSIPSELDLQREKKPQRDIDKLMPEESWYVASGVAKRPDED